MGVDRASGGFGRGLAKPRRADRASAISITLHNIHYAYFDGALPGSTARLVAACRNLPAAQSGAALGEKLASSVRILEL